MYKTQLNNRTLNNRPIEPQVVCAEYPTVWEQKNHFNQFAAAACLVTAIFLASLAIS